MVVGPFPLRPFGRGAKAMLANPYSASPKGAQGKRTHYREHKPRARTAKSR